MKFTKMLWTIDGRSYIADSFDQAVLAARLDAIRVHGAVLPKMYQPHHVELINPMVYIADELAEDTVLLDRYLEMKKGEMER